MSSVAIEPAAQNRVRISGRIVELGALRLTPAGLAVLDFRLRHHSEQSEAGSVRQVELELPAVAFESDARLLAERALDTPLRLEGFLCARNRRSRRLVLHVTGIEFIEGVE